MKKFGTTDIEIIFRKNDVIKYFETKEYIEDFERIYKTLINDTNYSFLFLDKKNISNSLNERNNLIFSSHIQISVICNNYGNILNIDSYEKEKRDLIKYLTNLKIESKYFLFGVGGDQEVYNIEE